MFELCPPGGRRRRRRKGRPRKSWMQEVTIGMWEKRTNNRQRRMEEKNKIKTLGTKRCANIDTLYINKIKYWRSISETVII